MSDTNTLEIKSEVIEPPSTPSALTPVVSSEPENDIASSIVDDVLSGNEVDVNIAPIVDKNTVNITLCSCNIQ